MIGEGFNMSDMSKIFTEGYHVLTRVFLPVLVLPVFAAAASVLVHGVTFSTKPLNPDLGKLNPGKGIKKIFSLDSVSELVKSIIKIVILSLVAVLAVRGKWAEIAAFSDLGVAGFALQSGRIMLLVISRTLWVFAVLAVGDYVYQKWRFEKGLRMSRQEIKEETKSTEGDPLVKSRIKSVQREMARRRMMEDVPTADVVITNPTRLAVALKYDREKAAAPYVVAKGRDLIAARIREIARENGVPIVEDKPLARSLYKSVEIGQESPVDLYKAVAGVLAYVYRLKNRGA
jgi:flagellar biosynthetic protein FlhB